MTQRLSLLKLYNLPCYASRRPSLENSRIQITETEDAKFYNYFASLKIFFFAEVFFCTDKELSVVFGAGNRNRIFALGHSAKYYHLKCN